MTHEQYITLDTAILAKQAGFDWDCVNYYTQVIYDNKDYELHSDVFFGSRNWNEKTNYFSAPTQAVLQKWLREEKSILLLVWHDHRDYFGYSAESNAVNIDLSTEFTGDKDTYEAALEAGLQKCLTLIVEKQ